MLRFLLFLGLQDRTCLNFLGLKIVFELVKVL